MYFTPASSDVFILFQQWRITSTQDVTGSFVAVLALAVLYECVTGLHVHLRTHLSHQERDRTLTRKKSDFKNVNFCRSYVSIQFSKTSLFVAELSFAYFLMLIAMTYNTWLFVAVVIGRGLGYYLVTPLIGSYIDSDDIDYHSYSDLWQDSPHPADI